MRMASHPSYFQETKGLAVISQWSVTAAHAQSEPQRFATVQAVSLLGLHALCRGGDTVVARCAAPLAPDAVHVTDNDDGTYDLAIATHIAGTFRCDLYVNQLPTAISPLSIVVKPGPRVTPRPKAGRETDNTNKKKKKVIRKRNQDNSNNSQKQLNSGDTSKRNGHEDTMVVAHALAGDGLSRCYVGRPASITLTLQDLFGNAVRNHEKGRGSRRRARGRALEQQQQHDNSNNTNSSSSSDDDAAEETEKHKHDFVSCSDVRLVQCAGPGPLSFRVSRNTNPHGTATHHFTISYLAAKPGKYRLAVEVRGATVQGSPFRIVAGVNAAERVRTAVQAYARARDKTWGNDLARTQERLIQARLASEEDSLRQTMEERVHTEFKKRRELFESDLAREQEEAIRDIKDRTRAAQLRERELHLAEWQSEAQKKNAQLAADLERQKKDGRDHIAKTLQEEEEKGRAALQDKLMEELSVLQGVAEVNRRQEGELLRLRKYRENHTYPNTEVSKLRRKYITLEKSHKALTAKHAAIYSSYKCIKAELALRRITGGGAKTVAAVVTAARMAGGAGDAKSAAEEKTRDGDAAAAAAPEAGEQAAAPPLPQKSAQAKAIAGLIADQQNAGLEFQYDVMHEALNARYEETRLELLSIKTREITLVQDLKSKKDMIKELRARNAVLANKVQTLQEQVTEQEKAMYGANGGSGSGTASTNTATGRGDGGHTLASQGGGLSSPRAINLKEENQSAWLLLQRINTLMEEKWDLQKSLFQARDDLCASQAGVRALEASKSVHLEFVEALKDQKRELYDRYVALTKRVSSASSGGDEEVVNLVKVAALASSKATLDATTELRLRELQDEVARLNDALKEAVKSKMEAVGRADSQSMAEREKATRGSLRADAIRKRLQAQLLTATMKIESLEREKEREKVTLQAELDSVLEAAAETEEKLQAAYGEGEELHERLADLSAEYEAVKKRMDSTGLSAQQEMLEALERTRAGHAEQLQTEKGMYESKLQEARDEVERRFTEVQQRDRCILALRQEKESLRQKLARAAAAAKGEDQ